MSLTKQSSEAWAKVIPVKVGDSVSVYISHPVPGEDAAGVGPVLTYCLLTLHVLVLPLRHVIARLPGPHGEQVCHHGGEAGREAGLGDEAELELRQADHVITLLPVPARDV